jgi:hypothetical protein
MYFRGYGSYRNGIGHIEVFGHNAQQNLAFFYGLRPQILEHSVLLLNPTTMSYLSVDGLVSGIKSHMIEAASKPTDAILRNVAAQSKFAAASPKSAVLSAAPSPDAVPTMP